MSMVTLQTETPKGAVAAPNGAGGPRRPPPSLADGESDALPRAIQVTLRALKRIRVAMAKEGITPDAGGLRLGITGGGCSGLSYNIKLRHPAPRARPRLRLPPDALVSTSPPRPRPRPTPPPIRIFVDPKSFIYLSGMVLDYEETLMRQGFNFINPHSTKSCGCGSSFST
jgi:iron-sulfur cluster assembly protein